MSCVSEIFSPVLLVLFYEENGAERRPIITVNVIIDSLIKIFTIIIQCSETIHRM